MNYRNMNIFIAAALSTLLCVPAFADWTVDPEGSYLGFASVKNDLIAENHSFTKITGMVSETGNATIRVPVESVETLIPLRNERMKSMLFDMVQFPDAIIASQLPIEEFTSLGIGEVKTATIDMTITLHGTDLEKSILVKVTRSSESSFEVTSLGPVVIHASQFALADGVESLRKIAGLQSIDLMVPVTFDLRLVKSDSVQ